MGTTKKSNLQNQQDHKIPFNAITDVPGIEVGHFTDIDNLTGSTVVLIRKGAVAGVDVRGSAPGTRETDLLNPVNLIQKIHAVVLTGGSAYGLATADGVMDYLRKQGIGFPTGGDYVVPIVPAAALYDLGRGKNKPFRPPDASFGFFASKEAKPGPVQQGNVGAGTGALTGTIIGNELKGGLGTASTYLGSGIVVGALVVVNSGGSPIDPATGKFYASFLEKNNEFNCPKKPSPSLSSKKQKSNHHPPINTTIGVVATNVELTKSQATKVAQMAHDGIARAIRPSHTMFDGDTIFSLSTGEIPIIHLSSNRETWGEVAAKVNLIGATAADTLSRAIIHAMIKAETIGGIESYRDRYFR